jgi:hypothetical protein
MILKKVNFKNCNQIKKRGQTVELTTSNAIVILGSSFVDLWLLPILIVLGLML